MTSEKMRKRLEAERRAKIWGGIELLAGQLPFEDRARMLLAIAKSYDFDDADDVDSIFLMRLATEMFGDGGPPEPFKPKVVKG